MMMRGSTSRNHRAAAMLQALVSGSLLVAIELLTERNDGGNSGSRPRSAGKSSGPQRRVTRSRRRLCSAGAAAVATRARGHGLYCRRHCCCWCALRAADCAAPRRPSYCSSCHGTCSSSWVLLGWLCGSSERSRLVAHVAWRRSTFLPSYMHSKHRGLSGLGVANQLEVN